MSFRFNFAGDQSLENNSVEVKDKIQWLDSLEIKPGKQIYELDNMIGQARMFTCGEVEIGHIVVSDAISNMSGEPIEIASKLAKEKNNDLIIGKYEGGLKIWECTSDLIQYLVENNNTINFEDVKVLDLGCGAGLLGIYAFLKGSIVTFQDYNKEVLEYVTIPNILLNIDEEQNREESIKKCNFFSGDWASFNQKLGEDVCYDLILTSETIYNELNYDKLVQLFAKRLSNGGIAFVAAKTCYFGVGGGIRQFESAIGNSNLFNCEVCWKNMDGIQREILTITKKKQLDDITK